MQGKKIGIIGSGSWATAMIKMLCENDQEKHIFWWVRKEEDAEYIEKFKHDPTYLSSVSVDLSITTIDTDAKNVITNSDIVILNTPAAYLKDALANVTKEDFRNKIVVSAIKGIIPKDNLIIGEFLEQRYEVDIEQICVVGGPCHAEEVALGKLSYLTFGCKNLDSAALVASFLSSRVIKTILSEDVLGIEFGAVLKNIYALAGGICHGLGYGDNFQAVLVSNAIREMRRFVGKVDGDTSRDVNTSAYLGDLLVTAYSQFSRNRTFGNMIGKGYSVQSAQLEMNMVAEGYYASACIQEYAKKYAVELPICDAVHQILYEHLPASKIIQALSEKLT